MIVLGTDTFVQNLLVRIFQGEYTSSIPEDEPTMKPVPSPRIRSCEVRDRVLQRHAAVRSSPRSLGVYYTSADITDYMARHTILPLLFRRLVERCPGATCYWPLDGVSLPERINAGDDLQALFLAGLQKCSDRSVLERVWQMLNGLTILDPACGSGAFLVAALRVLEPIHRLCLMRLPGVADPAPVSVRRRILANNLFGVDLMPAAISECQRLVSELAEGTTKTNLRIGNALTGRAWGASRGNSEGFDWEAEFPELAAGGGADVVLGNPPYLEIRDVPYVPTGFHLHATGAIHALFLERAQQLLAGDGAMSLIVPLSLVSTQRMRPAQELLEADGSVWYLNFAWRPAKLFPDVNRALTIVLKVRQLQERTFTTGYQKWKAAERPSLMARIRPLEIARQRATFWVPKINHPLEHDLLTRCQAVVTRVRNVLGTEGNEDQRIYYRTDGGLYWKVFTNFAPGFWSRGRAGHSSRETWITVARPEWVVPLLAILSSDLFWWWYTISSNCRHLNPCDIHDFPLPLGALEDETLATLGREYLADIVRHSVLHTRRQRQTGHTQTQMFRIHRSRPLIERLDQAVAPHYGLTSEEIAFVKNYDLTFRMAAARTRRGASG